MVSSSMVVTASTKGTRSAMARDRSPAWLAIAPISRPPAEPPSANTVSRAAAQVEAVDGARRNERPIAIAHVGRGGIWVVAQRHDERGFVRRCLDSTGLRRAPGHHPHARIRRDALLDGDGALEESEIVERGILAMRDELLPCTPVSRVGAGLDEPEVERGVVGADHPAATEMVGIAAHA